MKSANMDEISDSMTTLVRYYEVFGVDVTPPLNVGRADSPITELVARAQKALDTNTPIDLLAVYGAPPPGANS